MSKLEDLKKIAVYAKYLYWHGCSHSLDQDPVQRMIALHDLHNAVEWLLGGLWTYYFGARDKPWSMSDLFKQIANKQKLILMREIGMLSEARNQAQHHAIAPSPDALTKYMGYCETFFRETLRQAHPDLEYDDLLMGVLVPNLGFRIRSEPMDERYVQLLGGKVELGMEAVEPESLGPCLSFNLRTMMIQAERRLNHALQGEDAQQAASDAMIALASCLTYAQLFAIQALRDASDEDPLMFDPDGHKMDVSSIDHGPLRAARASAFGNPPLGLFPSAKALTRVSWSGLVDYEDVYEEVVQPVIEEMSQILRTALEKLSLGIDPKSLWRFERLFTAATSDTAKPLGNAELLWSHDFVLNTILDLSPMIQEVVSADLVVELDAVWGAHIRSAHDGEMEKADEDSLPF